MQDQPCSAIIVAAGLSSRMGSFKPLLSLGADSFISRIVKTFTAGGIDDIIVVVGHNKELLTEHLRTLPVRLVENPDYKTTDMFASVRLGLAAVAPTSEYTLLTTVDTPLFTLHTVLALQAALWQDKHIVIPRYAQKMGHPIGLSREIIPKIMAHREPPGLHHALAEHEALLHYVPTADEGILQQANTPNEYEALLCFMAKNRIPDAACCAELQHFFATSPQVVRHCAKVAAVAGEIAEKFLERGIAVDAALVQAGALLHDLLRVQPQHGPAAAEALADLGYNEVAEVVRDHMFLGQAGLSSPYEKFIVYIADKLVEEDQRVDLQQRYNSTKQRRGIDEEALKVIAERQKEALAILEQMEALLGEKI